MSEFYVGQRIVRVKRTCGSSPDETTPRLEIGEICIVRWIGMSRFFGVVGEIPAIRIVERVRTFSHGFYRDWPLTAEDFRPLEPRAMSIFRAIAADPSRKLEDV